MRFTIGYLKLAFQPFSVGIRGVVSRSDRCVFLPPFYRRKFWPQKSRKLRIKTQGGLQDLMN